MAGSPFRFSWQEVSEEEAEKASWEVCEAVGRYVVGPIFWLIVVPALLLWLF